MAFGLDMSEYLDKLTELQENQTMYSENISNLHNKNLCNEIRILSTIVFASMINELINDPQEAVLEAYSILASIWED